MPARLTDFPAAIIACLPHDFYARQKWISVSEANARAVEGENNARVDIANSEALRNEKELMKSLKKINPAPNPRLNKTGINNNIDSHEPACRQIRELFL